MGAKSAAERLTSRVEEAIERGVLSSDTTVVNARMEIVNLRAEAVRRDAMAMIHQDAEDYKKRGWIQDAATRCADRVEAMIKKFTDEGIPHQHPKLMAAYEASK